MPAESRVLVVGGGSAGARHARHLLALGAAVTVADPDPQRAHGVDGAAALVTAAPPDDDRFDGVVVASPTVCHAAHAVAALATGARVLIEKPMATTTAEARDVVAAGGDRIMVGYNLRLFPPVARFVELARSGAAGEVAHLRAWFGSHLPDWRPDVDYRTTYSARRDQGGGVLMDASHELDLVVWLLGRDLEVAGGVLARVGGLEIDVEDVATALLYRADGVTASITLDYLSRTYRRGLELVGTEATITLDWARASIEIATPAGATVEPFADDVADTYRVEAERFLAFVRGGVAPPCGAADGAASVELVERIRAAAAR